MLGLLPVVERMTSRLEGISLCVIIAARKATYFERENVLH
jgi:hypothetical protein